MEYESLRNTLGSFFNSNPALRKFFLRSLDLFLLRSWHVQRELRIWSRVNKGPKHILDAGSGFGQYSYFLTRLNSQYNVLGLDINAHQVSDCNRFFRQVHLNKVYFKKGDVKNLDQIEAYDLILGVGLLEYIEDEQELFNRFYTSLKDKGVVLIATLSDQLTWELREQNRHLFGDIATRKGFNINEIKEKFKKAGFYKVRARYSFGKPGALSWIISMKIPVQMVRKTKFLLFILPVYYLITSPICLILNYLDTHMGHTSGKGIIVKAYK